MALLFHLLPFILLATLFACVNGVSFKEHVVRCPITDDLQVGFIKDSELFDIWAITQTYMDIRIRNVDEDYAIALMIPECVPWIDDLALLVQQEVGIKSLLLDETNFFNNYQVLMCYLFN